LAFKTVLWILRKGGAIIPAFKTKKDQVSHLFFSFELFSKGGETEKPKAFFKIYHKMSKIRLRQKTFFMRDRSFGLFLLFRWFLQARILLFDQGFAKAFKSRFHYTSSNIGLPRSHLSPAIFFLPFLRKGGLFLKGEKKEIFSFPPPMLGFFKEKIGEFFKAF